MGYTHYWEFQSPVTEEQVANLFEKGKPIMDKFKDILEDNSKKDHIHFNGIDEGQHEDMWIKVGDNGFNFCKTAYKPYDTPSTAFLIMAKCELGNQISIRSDGDNSDWEKGVEAYNEIFKQNVSIDIEGTDLVVTNNEKPRMFEVTIAHHGGKVVMRDMEAFSFGEAVTKFEDLYLQEYAGVADKIERIVSVVMKEAPHGDS